MFDQKLRSLLHSVFILVVLSSFQACTKDENEKEDADSYVGTWRVDETSSVSANSVYNVHINKVSENRITIENFYNYGFNNSITADIAGNQITIYAQTFSGTNNVEGSGSLIGVNKINLAYTVDDGSGVQDDVSATLTKQ